MTWQPWSRVEMSVMAVQRADQQVRPCQAFIALSSTLAVRMLPCLSACARHPWQEALRHRRIGKCATQLHNDQCCETSPVCRSFPLVGCFSAYFDPLRMSPAASYIHPVRQSRRPGSPLRVSTISAPGPPFARSRLAQGTGRRPRRPSCLPDGQSTIHPPWVSCAAWAAQRLGT